MTDLLSGRLASHPRNKQIAAIFKEAGIIEKYGSGIKRVRKVMADTGAAEPIFEIVSDCFKVTLFPSGGVSGGVSDVLDYIKLNPGKNTRQITTVLNLSQRTLERMLKELKREKKIEFRGAPRSGGYFFIENGES